MIKALKVKLNTNNVEKTKLLNSASVGRWAYNFALNEFEQYYKETGKFLNPNEIRKRITILKKTAEYKWLNQYSNNIVKQAVKDCCKAFMSFFKKKSKYPRYKSKKKTKPSFYQDTHKIKFKSGKVRIEKVGWIRLWEKERIPEGVKYSNPRVTFDGIDWFVSVGVEYEPIYQENINEGIGIDVGIKDLAVCSNGNIYKNINKTTRLKRLTKKMKRLQRKVSRQYEQNKKESEVKNRYCKTNNIIKTESKLRKLHIKLKNVRTDYIHKTTTEVVKTKPEFIVVEDLNISGMMKNKHLSRAIQEQNLYEFNRQLEYKTNWSRIKFIKVDKWYPSSKTCNNCGDIKKDLKLSERVFRCSCGYTADRDYNASLNLRDYGLAI